MRFQFRVSKFDPRFRGPGGAYTREEWTSVSDIGRVLGGVTLTAGEYERVEAAYTSTVVAMLSEVGVESLIVNGLEQHGDVRAPFGERTVVPLEKVAEVARDVLREEYWCRLESPIAFVHFGYDYCMYVGVPEHPSRAFGLARERGLFVEEYESPYVSSEGGSG